MSALIVAVALVSAAGAEDKPKDRIEASTKRIKELRTERIDTLTKLVDQASAQFQRARGSYEDVLEAHTLLLQARLDAAENGAERIKLYASAVDLLTQTEKVAQAHIAAGRGTETAVLKIKARRLDVEIKLEQAKIKEAKEKK
jgi:hypothetical protein